MKFLFVLVCLVLMVGCASPQVFDRSGWEDFGHPLFVSKINEVSGADAINCGHFNQIPGKDHEEIDRETRKCIGVANKEKYAYKFGTLSIVSDLYLFDVIILSPDGTYWLVEYGVMLDYSDHHTRVEKCDEVKVLFNPLRYKREVCEFVDAQEWYDKVYKY